MGVYIIRAFFILLTTLAGYLYWSDKRIVGVLGGLIGSIIIVGLEWLLERVPFKKPYWQLASSSWSSYRNFLQLYSSCSIETVREENAVRFIFY